MPAAPRQEPALPDARQPASKLPYLPQPLPPSIEDALWRASELGAADTPVIASGWGALDAELPSGGWPCQALTEILTPQPSVLEWRLLAPALRRVVAGGGQIIVIGPPRHPHLPGLLHEGLDERKLVWIVAETPAERLWTTEQLIKSNAAGAIVAWLPQARQEQLRRLQVCAQACEGLTFLCRPESARHEASAAPLRVHAAFALDWALRVNVFKRRGPAQEGVVTLPSIPGGLAAVLTPRVDLPSRWIAPEVPADVVGSPVVAIRPRLHAAAQ